MTTRDDPASDFVSRYAAAVHAKDVDAFVALYADDVCVFDMWGTWSYDGIAAWRGMAEGWFGSLGDERVVVEFSDVTPVAAPDLVMVRAFVRYTAVDAAGASLRSLNNRMSVALRRTGDAWKVVHEHSSSPIDLDTTKAMFTR
jgi:ketosteroid isomerase-like protein